MPSSTKSYRSSNTSNSFFRSTNGFTALRKERNYVYNLPQSTFQAIFIPLVVTENLEERIDLKQLTMDPPALQFIRDRYSAAKN